MSERKNYYGSPIRPLEDQVTVYPPKDESWRPLARCLGMDASLFFPERGDDYSQARKVCRACVVRSECLEYALTPPIEKWGCWGGTSERDRRKLRIKSAGWRSA